MNRAELCLKGPVTGLADLLRLRAAEQSSQRAYAYLPDGENIADELTYGELDGRARGLAKELLRHDVVGQPVLICEPPGLGYIAGFFACLYAGAIAVPAFPPDPQRRSRTLPRLQAILKDAGGVACLAPEADLPMVRGLIESVSSRVPEHWVASDRGFDPAADEDIADQEPLVPNEGDSPAFLMYTSGSTRAPRGVVVSHANALHNLQGFPGFAGRPPTAFVSWLPFFHDLGLFLGMLHPLYRGCPSYLMPPAAFVQRPWRWLEIMSRFRASTTGGPNFAFDLCASRIRPEEREGLDLSEWNLALNGAEPVRSATLERFTRHFAPYGFRHEAHYPSLGLAEGSATVTGDHGFQNPVLGYFDRRKIEEGQVVEVEDTQASDVTLEASQTLQLVGCGGGLSDQRIAIVDPQSGLLCEAHEVGEIWVHGDSVAQGYWRREEESEAVFGARLADSNEGPFLRTGDLGFFRGDELFVVGRWKDLIILQGVNHHPEDLEQTIGHCHPSVRPNCGAAFAVEVDGRERLAIVQEVSLQEDSPAEEVIAAMREALARVHSITPHRLVLIASRTLPKTSSGKIQRRHTGQLLAEGQLKVLADWQEGIETSPGDFAEKDPSLEMRDQQAKGLQEKVQERLVQHFAGRLGCSAESINIQQSFERFGLASLEAIELVRELEDWLDISLPPTLLWDHPSIAAVARHLSTTEGIRSSTTSSQRRPTSFSSQEPIAIVGMACRFPGAPDLDAFWRLLREGRDVVDEVPAERWDADGFFDTDAQKPGKMVSRRGGFLPDLDRFDAEFFAVTPREANHLDPRQRLILEVTWEALENAQIPPDRLAGSRGGVYVAALSNDYDHLISQDVRRIQAYTGPGTAETILANRVSYVLDLIGPSMTINTACSGSLVALHLACQSLRSGESSFALVGGVNVVLMPKGNVFFSKAGALSPTGGCKAFDHRADGIVRSDGAGMVVLKPLSQALADGDRVHSVIRGTAVNSDGRSNGIMAPNGRSQELLLREAYGAAGIDPARVQYVEAHGTGTSVGDPIEVRALGSVLGAGRGKGRETPCLLGSLKSNVGHMEAASGIAGVMKVALALQHGEIPPSLHFEQPNPLIPFTELGFRVQEKLSPWPQPGAPIAGVSSFGFGGTNAHVVMEGFTARDTTPAEAIAVVPEVQILPLSARSAGALRQLAERYRAMEISPEQWSALCRAAALGREHQEHRLTVVASSPEELDLGLSAFAEEQTRAGLAVGRAPATGAPKVAFVFSGQGSLWAGMGRQLLGQGADQEAVFRQQIAACEALLSQHVDWKLTEELSREAEHSRLTRTDIGQPAIFAVQVALAALWGSWGIEPDLCVGHSLGEAAAAYVSGALSLEDALAVVMHRSRLMQEVAGAGATAVVGLSFKEAQLALLGFRGRLAVAGSNSPQASVVAGEPEALDSLLEMLEEQGVFNRLVQGVDIAFHSPQMDPLQGRLVESLAHIQPQEPSIPMLSTVTGEPIQGAALDAEYWGKNLRQPVMFGKALETLLADDYRVFLEIAPHPVLGASMQQGFGQTYGDAVSISSLRRGEGERANLLHALGRLHVAGCPVRWAALFDHPQEQVTLPPVELPNYPWQRERFWYEETTGAAGASAAGAARGRRGRVAGAHPFLGERVAVASEPQQYVWELDLTAADLGFIADHQIQQAVVFPGAALLEMVLSAAKGLGVEHPRLEKAEFKRALIFPENGWLRLQLLLQRRSADGFTFRVSSDPEGQDQERWTLHMDGELCPAPERDRGVLGAVDLDDVRRRCGQIRPSADHYTDLDQRGIELGPAFRPMGEIRYRDGEACAPLRLPSAAGRSDVFRVHPVLLDAVFQLISAALPETDDEDAFLPAGVESLQFYGSPTPEFCWGHATLRSPVTTEAEDHSASPVDEHLADVALLGEKGEVFLQVQGLHLLRLGAGSERPRPESALHHLRWVPQVKEAHTEVASDLANGCWWVVGGSALGAGTLGDSLEAALTQDGATVRRILPHSGPLEEAEGVVHLDPTRREHWRQLLEQGGDSPCRGVVHLSCLEVDGTQADAVENLCSGVLALAQALAGHPQPPRLWLLTRGVQRVQAPQDGTLSEPDLDVAAQAVVWGLGRVIHRELPEVRAGLIDLAAPADLPQALEAGLLAELRNPDEEWQVALRGRERFVARLDHWSWAVAADKSTETTNLEGITFRTDAAYLITGGLGGLGLVTARWMALRGARRILLAGRGSLPPRTEWAGLREQDPRVAAVLELEQMGTEVTPVALDLSDGDALGKLLQERRQQGRPPIRGVIHAAGVVEDQLLADLDSASLVRVLRPKVAGALHLHRHFAAGTVQEPVDFFIFYSSIAALLPPAGQGAYAAGNAYLDTLAEQHRAAGLPALSIGWGPWTEVGMAARHALAGRHEEAGVRGISPAQGIEILEKLLQASAPASVAAIFADWAGIIRQAPGDPFLALLAAQAEEGAADAVESPEKLEFVYELLLADEPDQQRGLLEERIREHTAAVMGLDPQRLDRQKSLTALGMDSIMAVELSKRMEGQMGLSVSLMDLLKGSSVAQLATQLLERLSVDEEMAEISGLLSEVEGEVDGDSAAGLVE